MHIERGGGDVLHKYFKKLAVEVHNIDVLSGIPGQLIVLESTDTGVLSNWKAQSAVLLHLKKAATSCCYTA